jgi:hypothetical protein
MSVIAVTIHKECGMTAAIVQEIGQSLNIIPLSGIVPPHPIIVPPLARWVVHTNGEVVAPKVD